MSRSGRNLDRSDIRYGCATGVRDPMTTFYAIFARPYMNPGDLEFLALYSSQALAQRFIDCQDEQIRECLLVLNVEVDRHPSAEFWKRPDD